jgi:hypothetical protein
MYWKLKILFLAKNHDQQRYEPIPCVNKRRKRWELITGFTIPIGFMQFASGIYANLAAQ